MSRLGEAAPADRARLRARIRGAARGRGGRAVGAIAAEIDRSASAWALRRGATLRLEFPAELPVSQRRDDLAAAIRDHQVVIVCGETGSGKTTQLPKICLELGMGRDRLIGHTQPRRIAARTVAARIAEETQTRVGGAIGCKVRFDDESGPSTMVKLMTDGILLAETRSDRTLEAYEAIIIDEAHERSLNIDFLMGYLRRLLPRRPDLKVIVTSATIDPERFAEHFSGPHGEPAPIVEVSGRTYPVEVRYRPLTDAQGEQETRLDDALIGVMDEIDAEGSGDVLVFMPGEREIRETTRLLRGRYERDTSVEVLPLYARLSPADQMRVFRRHPGRRIVVSTNVAETSLTVPGIRYVVDPGTARISRYSARSKMQALPVEAISRASADQRKGRCGRVGPGVCYRLFSEEDYTARDEFTLPEIKRTSLAAVVLQMADLGLGRPEEFPFVERPELRQIRDGYQTLRELGAVDEGEALTPLGKRMARLPIDPRLARMILAAIDEGCVHDVLVIASGLTAPDPRDRPYEKRDAADEAHKKFNHPDSDFLAYLNIWDFYHEQAASLSRSKLAKACEQNFLSARRIGEWRLLYRQLRSLAVEMGIDPGHGHAQPDAVHRALLAGLLANIGHRKDTGEYAGTRGSAFFLFPGSSLSGAKPKWVMAGEIVRTTRVFARGVARINPDWVERVGAHLIDRTHSDARWEERSARVMANEKVTLLGLELVRSRPVHYGPIDPPKARELFIHHALVEGEWETDAPAIVHNRALAERLATLEHKTRRADLLADNEARFAFYDARVPADVFTGQGLEAWLRREAREDPGVLRMREEDLLVGDASTLDEAAFPDRVAVGGAALPLEYRFAPGEDADGVTMRVPAGALARVRAEAADWLVEGLLAEKIAALIRTLPRSVRRQFDAAALAPELARTLPRDRPLPEAVAAALAARSGVPIDATMLRPADVPAHLAMRYEVLGEAGEALAAGRDLPALQRAHAGAAPEPEAPEASEWHRDGVTAWDFGDLPETLVLSQGGVNVTVYPALVDTGDAAGLRVLGSRAAASEAMRWGLARLYVRHLRDDLRFTARDVPGMDRAAMLYAPLGPRPELERDAMLLLAERVFVDARPDVRTRAAFEARLDEGWNRLGPAAEEVGALVGSVLASRHALLARLEGPMPPAWHAARADLLAQLAGLVRPGFVRSGPWGWVRCLPRYLRAMEVRLERLRTIGPARDAQRQAEVQRWDRAVADRAARHREQGIEDPALAEFRWLVQELRVGVFAQELGTVVKVSTARLEEAWAKVRA